MSVVVEVQQPNEEELVLLLAGLRLSEDSRSNGVISFKCLQNEKRKKSIEDVVVEQKMQQHKKAEGNLMVLAREANRFFVSTVLIFAAIMLFTAADLELVTFSLFL
jgi:hypothetical protein